MASLKRKGPDESPTPSPKKRTPPPSDELVASTPKGGQSVHFKLSDWINETKEKYSLYYKTIYDKDFIFSRDDSLHTNDENYAYYKNLLAEIKSLLQKLIRRYENQYKGFKKPELGMQWSYLLKDIEKKDLIYQFETWRMVYQDIQAEIQELENPPPMSPIPPTNHVPFGTCVPETPPPYPATNIGLYFLTNDEKKEQMERLMAKYELRLKKLVNLFRNVPAVNGFVTEELANLRFYENVEARFNKLNQILKATKEMTLEILKNDDNHLHQALLERLEKPKSMQMIL